MLLYIHKDKTNQGGIKMKRNELIVKINNGYKPRLLKSMVVEIFKNLDNKRTAEELYAALVICKSKTMYYYFSDEFLDKIIYGSYSLKNVLMELRVHKMIENYEFDFLYTNKDVRREMVLNRVSEIVLNNIIKYIEELC